MEKKTFWTSRTIAIRRHGRRSAETLTKRKDTRLTTVPGTSGTKALTSSTLAV